MLTLYRLGDRDGDGLYCDRNGLTYGGLPLVAKAANGRYAPVALDGILKSALAPKAGGIQAVANALNDGQLARAMIAAVNLGLAPATRADIARLQKWDFDPDQPRDAQGRWTSGDDDSGDTPQPGTQEDPSVDANPMDGAQSVSFQPDDDQDGMTAEAVSTNGYQTVPGLRTLADANTIVEGMDGGYFPNPNPGGSATTCTNLTHALMPSLPPASLWLRGDQVQENFTIPIGTPIATFNYYGSGTNGYGPVWSPGGAEGLSHTGIYLGQTANNLIILNQFGTSHGVTISYIPWALWHNSTLEAGYRYYTIRIR